MQFENHDAFHRHFTDHRNDSPLQSLDYLLKNLGCS